MGAQSHFLIRKLPFLAIYLNNYKTKCASKLIYHMIHLHPSLLRLFLFFFLLQDIVVNIFVGAKKDFEEGFAHMFNKNNHFIHRNLKRSLFLYRDYLDFEFLN
jgi:hypothetical protein